MSDLNEKKEMTKEEFAANEIREFCKYVMHPESDLHKDAEDWIKERLQANGVTASDSGLHLQRVSPSTLYDCDDCMNYPCVLQEWSSDKGRKLKLNECGDKVVKKLL